MGQRGVYVCTDKKCKVSEVEFYVNLPVPGTLTCSTCGGTKLQQVRTYEVKVVEEVG